MHPQATADELKASVMSLRLGATSPGIRKATSTHSLNGRQNSHWLYFVCEERYYIKHQSISVVNKTTSKENSNFKSGATTLSSSVTSLVYRPYLL